MARDRTFGNFTTNILPHAQSYGGYLMFEIEASHEQIRTKLGTSLSSERKRDYSSSIYVRHIDTGFIFSVYMSYGHWRIGAVDTCRRERMSDNETYKRIARELESILCEF